MPRGVSLNLHQSCMKSGVPTESLQGGTKTFSNDPAGASQMAFPAPARGYAIGGDIKAKDRARAFSPAHASRIGIEQFSINRQALPIIVSHLTAWRYILKHHDFIMISIQVYLTRISYGKISCKRAQVPACQAEKRLPEIYAC